MLSGRTLRMMATLLGPIALLGCSSPAPDANASARAAEAPAPTIRPRPAGPERLVVAFGDSLYAGYGLRRGEALPDRLEDGLRAAGINATLVRAGVSGDTTAAGRQRFAFTLDQLPRKPDLIVLGLGGNDALRQIDPGETRANLTAMMNEAKKRGIPVLLTGMLAPPNLGPDYARAFEPIWPDLARRNGAALYPFILDGVITDPRLMQRDGVHPTAAGVQKMSDALVPLVAKALR